MDDLTYTLRQLCLRNRDGSHATQADRQRSLGLAAHQLREAGFRQMRATSLKGKHVEALLQRWQAEGLSTGTLKNRMAHLRWWAEKVGKAGILPADNTKLGIAERRYVTNESRAKELGDRLDRVTDPHVRMSLRLQAAFGLRREESIKFQPRYADRLAGFGSLIPVHKTYIQQRHVYDGQCKAAGLSNMHGLRHRYAQMRYEVLTERKALAAGGPGKAQLNSSQRLSDQHARQQISRELGHERLKVTSIYLGS